MLKTTSERSFQSCAGIYNTRDMGRTTSYSHDYHRLSPEPMTIRLLEQTKLWFVAAVQSIQRLQV